jgi:hypothetical protein
VPAYYVLRVPRPKFCIRLGFTVLMCATVPAQHVRSHAFWLLSKSSIVLFSLYRASFHMCGHAAQAAAAPHTSCMDDTVCLLLTGATGMYNTYATLYDQDGT